MKYLLIFLLSLLTVAGYSQGNGNNPGYYGTIRTDQQTYDIMGAAGATSTRSTVSIWAETTFGMPTFEARLQYPYTTKGFRSNTYFLFASTFDGTYTGRSDSLTVGGAQSWLPQGLYLAAFNGDGTINTNNKWGLYVYNCIQSIGAYYVNFEVWNESDLTFSPWGYTDSLGSPTQSWQKNKPKADDLPNTNANPEDYVQLCKIANQVVKKYYPQSKIWTGGLGYPWYYMWFLRMGGAQWIDGLSIHIYPYFDWTLYPNINHRNSDYAVQTSLTNHIEFFRQIETQEHATHIPMMITETNVPRWEFDKSSNAFPNNKRYGSSHVQRNFALKAYARYYQDSIKFLYLYQTGETSDSGNVTGSEINAMGLYKNLTTATPGTEVLTDQGKAMITYHNLLKNYTTETTIITSPAGTYVVRYDSAGVKAYMAWASTINNDTSEVASGSWAAPAGFTFKKYNWDQSSPGTVSGTISLTGDPIFLMPSGVIPPPPPPSCNCIVGKAAKNIGSGVPVFGRFIKINLADTCINPTVSAGPNQTITEPNDAAQLNGVAAGNNGKGIKTFSWSQISGETSIIATPGSINTLITNLDTVGVYVYKLTTTDSCGSIGTSQVSVTVQKVLPPPPPPPPPVVTTTGIKVTPSTTSTLVTVSHSNSTTTNYTVKKGTKNENTYIQNGLLTCTVTFSDNSITVYTK